MRAEKRHDMKAHVRRNVTDTNFFVAGVTFRVVLVTWNVREKFIEAKSLRKKFFPRDGQIVQVEQKIVVLVKLNSFCLLKLRRIFQRTQVKFGVDFIMFDCLLSVADKTICLPQNVVNQHQRYKIAILTIRARKSFRT